MIAADVIWRDLAFFVGRIC